MISENEGVDSVISIESKSFSLYSFTLSTVRIGRKIENLKSSGSLSINGLGHQLCASPDSDRFHQIQHSLNLDMT